MKRISTLLILSLFFSLLSYSQTPGQWTWMSGGQVASSPVWGTMGVPSVSNHPGSLYEVVSWTDAQGNFWIYGGTDLTGGPNYDDLWKYNPSTNEWTWVFGTSLTNAVPYFGTKGISSPLNTPGNRGYGTIGWIDQSGNLWLFGGWCWGMSGEMNDVWKYDMSTGEWTWMSGTNLAGDPGTYGTKGIPSVSNSPAARLEGPSYWQDSTYFWLFGGEGNSVSKLEDVWRFNPSTNEWTWMSGNNFTTTSVYGTKGVSNPANTPGGRQCYTHWTDKVGKFWIFGGTDYNGGDFGDLWKYDPVTNDWAWMGGSAVKGSPGSYPSYCVNDTNASPGGIYENKACWTDRCGNFWMFGGFSRNDLWQYNPTTNAWKFISGSNVQNFIGSYGALGVSSATNMPDARGGGSAFLDLNGNLWMYGGYSYGSTSYTYGDLWRFVPDTLCTGGCGVQSLPAAHFVSSDTAFCNESGECIDFTDHSTGNPTSWKWLFPGAVPDTSSIQNPTGICYYTPGTYAVTLIVSNGGGSDTLNVSPLITFGSGAALPFLYQSSDTLFCSHAAAYQWYYNGSPISGATDSFYVADSAGTYNAYITDSIGCSRLGNGIVFTEVNELNANQAMKIYPNPAKNELWIESNGLWDRTTRLEIINVLGESVYNPKPETRSRKPETAIDVSSLSSGIYIVEVTTGDKVFRTKFVKE